MSRNFWYSYQKVLPFFLILMVLCLASNVVPAKAINEMIDILPSVTISEVRIDQPSADDDEYFELKGVAGTSLDGFTYLVIGDGTSGSGVIESVTDLTGNIIPSSGYFVAAESTFTISVADLTATLNFENSDNVTHVLVTGFTGTNGDDLDADDDGVLDVTPWSSVIDKIALVETLDSGDKFYGPPTVGPDGSYVPGHAFICEDGWRIGSFELSIHDTPGAANNCAPPPEEACGNAFTPIYTVQGSGLVSPLDGSEVAIEGVVVGDFQNNDSVDTGDLNGFFVQDMAGDSDPTTSNGIFVYASGGMDISVGDAVRVRGNVSEYHNLTQISASQIWLCSTGNIVPPPITLSLPLNSVDDLEPFEGVLVTFLQTLTISEYYNFGRYNEIVLTTDRFLTPTAEFEPGSDAITAAGNFLLNKITLDDGRSAQNPDPAIHPNGNVFDLSNLFRGGDTVANITGFIDQNDNQYRVQSIQASDYTSVNLRTATPPNVGGKIKVASFNVLNYFTTFDDGSAICGPSEDMDCRGADTAEEFTRQRDKIIAAISAIDADIVGLMEIENNLNDEAIIDLVAGLNDAVGAGIYAPVETGTIGTDAIKVALIYKPATVSLSGEYAILDSSVDPNFLDTKNRPTLAQSFLEPDTGTIFTVAVNHLKSKGSDCDDVGDPDTGDGAGNCNLTREAAAIALVDWLAGNPTGSGSTNNLIIGDLNSYDKEDPIDAIIAGADNTIMTDDDYSDLILRFQGNEAYSYVFDGQIGYLDHAMANHSMESLVTSVDIWHINADEPSLIDYDMSYKQDAQDDLYAPDIYRSSDHDPVIIGLIPFTMNPVEVYKNVLPGDQQKFPITITNYNLTSDTYDINRLPDTRSISIGFPTVVGPVAPGASATFDATVIVSESEELGSTKSYLLQGTSREHNTSLTSTINILVDYLWTYFPLVFK